MRVMAKFEIRYEQLSSRHFVHKRQYAQLCEMYRNANKAAYHNYINATDRIDVMIINKLFACRKR